MMTDTFKVGKKYKHKCSGILWECLGEHGELVWMKWLGLGTPSYETWSKSTFGAFTEHKEPKTIVRYVNVYPLDQISSLHPSRETADRQSGLARVACKRVEITYTEGEMDS